MNSAITIKEFSLSMRKLGADVPCPKIAVAVSGGGDSLAMALLLQEWVKAQGGEMLALTVDHRLRPGSTAEAEALQKILRARGIAHEILDWQGDKPSTHVQELAREARYQLLLQACRQRGFPVLAVAHNMEDQIETFWMRLAHGSGLDGLAAMAAVRATDGVSIIRPLLAFPRERLRATCLQHNVSWAEDPSNSNKKYLRVKLRQFEDVLAGEGLTSERLSMTVQKLDDAREALQVMAAEAVKKCVLLHPEGYSTLKMAEWRPLPREIQRRVLVQTLMILSPQLYPVGFEAIEQARLELLDPAFTGRTLSGCEIFPARQGDILVVREEAAVEGRMQAQEGRVWDRRFILSGLGFNPEALDVGALGEQGISELRKHKKVRQELETFPSKVRRVLPALWQGKNLLAVPHLGYYGAACPRDVQEGLVTFSTLYRPSVKVV